MPPDPTDLLAHLPHRDPFRFITRLVSLSRGEQGEAVWSLRGDEAFFKGHFPGDPIVPGVLISEALAQLSGVVGLHTDGSPRAGRLVHVDVRFDNAVRPPAEISLRSKLTRVLGTLYQFEVHASSNGAPVVRGSLTLAAVDQQSRA
jgi:3-hydroxyacyl-[acyl-carrier-protein] dehydratase